MAGSRNIGRAAAHKASGAAGAVGSRSGARSGASLASSPSVFPLAVHAGGRYLVDAQSAPALVWLEAAWMLPSVTPTQALAYLDRIQSDGFNAIQVFIPYFSGAVANYNGDFAFSTPGDFTTTPVAAYWNHIEYLIAACKSRGILFKLGPLYHGYGGDGTQGWWAVEASKSAAQIQAYGAWVATRFAAHTNIMWDCIGDYIPSDVPRRDALVAGIRSVLPAALCTGEPARGHNTDEMQPASGSWNLNFVYAPQASYDLSLVAYANNVGPVCGFEPYYELRTGPTITTQQCRAQSWFFITSGCLGGIGYGHEGVCSFGIALPGASGSYNSDWTVYYGAAARTHALLCRTFLAGRPWHRLVPDTGSALVTSGRGTYGAESYVSAAATSGPQNFGLVYIPGGGSVTVALSGFSGSVTARYLDPTTGAFTPATGSPFAASGSQAFNPGSQIGNNAAGATDWVLVLES